MVRAFGNPRGADHSLAGSIKRRHTATAPRQQGLNSPAGQQVTAGERIVFRDVQAGIAVGLFDLFRGWAARAARAAGLTGDGPLPAGLEWRRVE
jgi:hypothetical protein